MTVESTPRPTGAVLLAPSPAGGQVYDLMYYLKGAAAGGICCSITHGALTPVDVVKTRVQLDPAKVRPPLFAEFNTVKRVSYQFEL
jgi:solute carrier family 25 (mitochondrial phosphate transporter), member 3